MTADRPLRILLINAINTHVEVESRYSNLGFGYLASSARKKLGPEKIAFRVVDKDIARAAAEFKPDLAGISSVSQNFNIAVDYADRLSSLGIPVVMGGVHISALPQCLPKTVMAACLRESESSFAEIIRLAGENSLIPGKLANIPNIIYWENGRIRATEERPPEPNLDSIEKPARDLMHVGLHAHMFTSRGCPYRCVFCASSRFWDNLRFFSAEYVVDEIELLIKNYNVRMISFFDDLFVADRARLEKILRLLEARFLTGKVKFTCSCRANLVDKELAKILSRMGMASVGIGLESGNDAILAFLKGESAGVSKNTSAIDTLKNAGIAVNGSFVIGSPMETIAQMADTYNFIRHSRLDLFDIYMLTPFPGTPIWEYAEKRGLVSESMDWSRLSVNAYRMPAEKIVLLSETLSANGLKRMYNKFCRLRFFRNIIKVINHPMRTDVLAIGLNLLKEYIYGIFNYIKKGRE